MTTEICEDGTSPGSSVVPLPSRAEGLGQSMNLVLSYQKTLHLKGSVWEGICHALLPNARAVRWLPLAQPGENQGVYGEQEQPGGKMPAPLLYTPALLLSQGQSSDSSTPCLREPQEWVSVWPRPQRYLQVAVEELCPLRCSGSSVLGFGLCRKWPNIGKSSIWAQGRQAWLKADERVSAHQGEWR